MKETATNSIKRQRYHLKFIKKVVNEVEEGATQNSVSLKYKIGLATIGRWMKKYGSKEYLVNRSPQSYPDSLKRQVIHSITKSGMSIKEACIVYNIKSESTINNWLLGKYNYNNDICLENVISLAMSKKPRTPEELEIDALKKALAESEFKVVALNTMIDIAEKNLDIEIRKKSGSKQLKK